MIDETLRRCTADEAKRLARVVVMGCGSIGATATELTEGGASIVGGEPHRPTGAVADEIPKAAYHELEAVDEAVKTLADAAALLGMDTNPANRWRAAEYTLTHRMAGARGLDNWAYAVADAVRRAEAFERHEASAKARPERTVDVAPPSFVPDDSDVRLLQKLGKLSRRVKAADLDGDDEVDLSRAIIQTRAGRMADLNVPLIDWPRGNDGKRVRTGMAITDAGRAALAATCAV